MRRLSCLGSGFRVGDPSRIDVGSEPPLAAEADGDGLPPRHAVSLRWLTGTILTGLTSIVLMGAALTAALNDPNQFAAAPSAMASTTGAPIAFGRKGDRIQPLQEEMASREVLQVSTVTRQGESDFMKLKPFARIMASLSAPTPEFADQIPEYDALRIFADTTTEAVNAATQAADNTFYGAEVDGEVAVKMSDLGENGRPVNTALSFSAEEAEAIVRAAANFGPGKTPFAVLAYADAEGFFDEPDPENDPFSAVGVRIVPENVSTVTKSDEDGFGIVGAQEKIVSIPEGKALGALLADNAIPEAEAESIVAALSQLVDLDDVEDGEKVRIAYAPAADEDAEPPVIRVSIYEDGAHQATVARTDDGSFVRASEPAIAPEVVAEVGEQASYGTMPRLYDAVYETALEQEIPKPLIDQLIRIFAFDVDFQARISPGDTLEVFHSMEEEEADAGEPEILFASLTLGGTPKRFYRFRTPDDGLVDYYDADGRSAKKFLMRKPMTTGVLRSTFGMRRHPILGYRRMHSGVDYAAPRGTPIMASGDGVVEKAGRNSGYGNMIIIRHTNGYETLYGHQSSFAKGIKPGIRVRQGQIIGYVGSTGLSTGPHLHFEIRVNESPVDPLRIRLPRGRVLEDQMLADFEAERQRIDALVGIQPEETEVASSEER